MAAAMLASTWARCSVKGSFEESNRTTEGSGFEVCGRGCARACCSSEIGLTRVHDWAYGASGPIEPDTSGVADSLEHRPR